MDRKYVINDFSSIRDRVVELQNEERHRRDVRDLMVVFEKHSTLFLKKSLSEFNSRYLEYINIPIILSFSTSPKEPPMSDQNQQPANPNQQPTAQTQDSPDAGICYV